MRKRNARSVRLSPKAPLAIVFIMIIIVIGILGVMFWVFVHDDLNRIDTLNLVITSTPKDNTVSTADTTSTPDPDNSVTSEMEQTPPSNIDPLKTIVDESAAVEKSYFDDAIFIGDSISKGLKVYGVLPAANVIADQNVGIPTIANDKPAYMNTSGKKITLYDAIKTVPVKPKKIYIMLGLNGLPHYTNADHMPYYYKIIDEIKKRYPDAIIYVESVSPITAEAEKAYAKKNQDFTNKKINEFNNMVIKMCEEKKVYYISVRDVLVDKNGQLKEDIAAPDGVHFIKSGHEAMYKYFKTHTVPKVVINNAD